MNDLHLPFGHPAWIEIDKQQFKQNIEIIKKHIGHSKLCLPIKANAYGHGLIPIAKAAVEAKVEYLAVSCLQEGALLREAGIQIPILVLGAIHEEQISELLKYQLEFTIASLYKAKLVAEKCQSLQQKSRVHVEIDTGMQRTGVRPETAVDLLNYLHETHCMELVGIYTHLATADTPQDAFAKVQIQTFKEFVSRYVLNKNKDVICHIANSGGVCHFPESHMDMVRPGLLCFGYFPYPLQDELKKVRPFFSVKAKIAYFKVVEAGQGISYNHTYRTTQKTRIVTIPVGYGDGFRRALSNCGSVIIRGKKYPIVGNICMDQCMADIGQGEAYVGDEVTLIGRQGNEEISLDEMATLCDTIPYEILCGFNDRLPRYYYGADTISSI
jgi:alanine racemase